MGIKRQRSGEDLHALNSSSSPKFGSFILHVANDFENFKEDAVLRLSSESEARSESARYESFGLWSTGFNGICGECDSISGFGSGSGPGWWWSTNDNDGLRCCYCKKWTNISGGGELSDDDDDQQQRQLVLRLDNLGFPSYDKPSSKVMVVGSCNGLICLYAEQLNQVSLWNPVTKEFRILPKSSSSITIAAALAAAAGDGNVHRLFAFGFDDETKDYKVVLLSVSSRRMLDFVKKDAPAAPMECICRVEVYSLITDSWKLLKDITSLPGFPFPYPPDSSSSELFYLNDCCFFLAKLLYSSEEQEQCIPPPKLTDRFMISLDLTNEIVTPIQLPDHHFLHQISLCYLGKKIAFCYKQWMYNQVYGVNDSTCSWEGFRIIVINEHSSVVGGKPWANLPNFGIKLGLPGERNILRGISNDGVFALIQTTEIHGGGLLGNKKNNKLKLYNLYTGELKENFLSLSCDQVLSKAFPYEPSEASVIGEAAAADMVVKCSSPTMIID